jgi:hypothetical protein
MTDLTRTKTGQLVVLHPSDLNQGSHLFFLLLGPADDDLALLPYKERVYNLSHTKYTQCIPHQVTGLTGLEEVDQPGGANLWVKGGEGQL